MTHRPRWPTSRQTIAFCVLIAMLAPSVAYFLSRNDLTDTIEDLRNQLERASAKIEAQSARDECIRDLARDLNDADVNNSLAFNRYVIGLGSRGDIAALTVELDAAGLALRAARDAYVAQNCPGG